MAGCAELYLSHCTIAAHSFPESTRRNLICLAEKRFFLHLRWARLFKIRQQHRNLSQQNVNATRQELSFSKKTDRWRTCPFESNRYFPKMCKVQTDTSVNRLRKYPKHPNTSCIAVTNKLISVIKCLCDLVPARSSKNSKLGNTIS